MCVCVFAWVRKSEGERKKVAASRNKAENSKPKRLAWLGWAKPVFYVSVKLWSSFASAAAAATAFSFLKSFHLRPIRRHRRRRKLESRRLRPRRGGHKDISNILHCSADVGRNLDATSSVCG